MLESNEEAFESFGFLRSFKANSYRIFGNPWSSRNQFDFFQQSDSQIPADDTSQAADDLEPLPYQEPKHKPSSLPRTTRIGRKINIQARFRDF